MYDVLQNLTTKEIKCLDLGLVELVDVMPRLVPEDQKTADYAIVQAARVSYGNGTKSVNEDRGLIRYLMRHVHCYDVQTEVLTINGFKKWSEISKDDFLGIFDPIFDSLLYEQPQYLTEFDYNGPMYSVEHGGVSLLVTPEHTMYVKKKVWRNNKMLWQDEYSLIKASDLGDASTIRYCKIAPARNAHSFVANNIWLSVKSNKALLKLMGFFIGDGLISHTSANQISFSLKRSRKINYLYEISNDLGWQLVKTKSSYSINYPGISEQFREWFYTETGDKKIPDFLKRLNVDDAKALLEGLKNSDGSIKRGAWEYSTSVKAVAQDVQLIALHAGEAAHVGKKCTGMYNVSILSRMREPVINQNRKNTSVVEYNGKVYCAKTRTGILIVRRNGKIVLSGNTTPFEMIEFKFHCKMPIFVARQWIRHRTANVNEYSGRYSVMKDEFYFPTADNLRQQSKSNKQGGDTKIDNVTASEFLDWLSVFCEDAYAKYVEYLDKGVSREQARMILPLNLYTEWYWKIDLHNLFHFLGLRCDAHAQWEIRVFAEAMLALIQPIVPVAVEAWNDYHDHRGAMKLTKLEMDAINRTFVGQIVKGLNSDNKREQAEWIDKAARMGLVVEGD